MPRGAKRTEVKATLRGLGQRLKEMREERSLSQQELADMIGIHLSQLGRIERNLNTPSVETVLALAYALRVSTDALLTGDQNGQQDPEIKNLKLFERFRVLEGLAKDDQETAIKLIDALIAKERVKQAIAG